MDRLPDVCTYTDFRDNMTEHLERLKKARKPLLVTRNGRAAAVVLSVEMYESMAFGMSLEQSRAKLARSIEQARRGETVSVDEAFRKVREQLGLPSRAARKRKSAA